MQDLEAVGIVHDDASAADAEAQQPVRSTAEQHGVADRMVVVIGSDFGRTNFCNSENGKDHWPSRSLGSHEPDEMS